MPAWIERVLRALASAEGAELAGVGWVAGDAARGRGGLAFRAYQALDRRLFAPADDALAPVDASALLARAEATTTPAAARADVLLKLTSERLPDDWLAAPPLGVWSFDHLEGEGQGGAPFFWEIARRLPVTELVLRAHAPAGARVLASGFAATDPTSLVRGRQGPLWKAAGFVARALRDAAEPGEVERERNGACTGAGRLRQPGAFEVLRFTTSLGLRVTRDRLRLRSHEEPWFVALRRSRGSLVDGPMHGFEPIPMPGDRFYADPFLVPDGERLWLFFEDAERASGKGVIRCAEVRPDATLGESHVVLELRLSPLVPVRVPPRRRVVPAAGDVPGTAPSSSGARSQFPWHWKLEKVLLADVSAVDPTLFEHEGRLWLFAGVSESGGAAQDELFLYSADSLDGDWRPHPQNPVVADVRHARPAGPLFREGGELYRPGQDCSGAYGCGVLDPPGGSARRARLPRDAGAPRERRLVPAAHRDPLAPPCRRLRRDRRAAVAATRAAASAPSDSVIDSDRRSS